MTEWPRRFFFKLTGTCNIYGAEVVSLYMMFWMLQEVRYFRSHLSLHHLGNINYYDRNDFKLLVLQLDDMRKFLSRVFRRVFVRGLIYGNCNKEVRFVYIYVEVDVSRFAVPMTFQFTIMFRYSRKEKRSQTYSKWHFNPAVACCYRRWCWNAGI